MLKLRLKMFITPVHFNFLKTSTFPLVRPNPQDALTLQITKKQPFNHRLQIRSGFDV